MSNDPDFPREEPRQTKAETTEKPLLDFQPPADERSGEFPAIQGHGRPEHAVSFGEPGSTGKKRSDGDYFTRFVGSRFGRKLLDIIYEAAVMILYMGAFALAHKVLNTLLGQDATLFKKVPVSYIIDAGHALAIIRFLLEIVKGVVEAVVEIIKVPGSVRHDER